MLISGIPKQALQHHEGQVSICNKCLSYLHRKVREEAESKAKEARDRAEKAESKAKEARDRAARAEQREQLRRAAHLMSAMTPELSDEFAKSIPCLLRSELDKLKRRFEGETAAPWVMVGGSGLTAGEEGVMLVVVHTLGEAFDQMTARVAEMAAKAAVSQDSQEDTCTWENMMLRISVIPFSVEDATEIYEPRGGFLNLIGRKGYIICYDPKVQVYAHVFVIVDAASGRSAVHICMLPSDGPFNREHCPASVYPMELLNEDERQYLGLSPSSSRDLLRMFSSRDLSRMFGR